MTSGRAARDTSTTTGAGRDRRPWPGTVLVAAVAVLVALPALASASVSVRAADVPCSVARITPSTGAFVGSEVSVSTDGTRVVYEAGTSSIALFDETTGDTEIITDANEPTVAGSGSHVVYVDGSGAIWRRTFEPGTPELISADLTNTGVVSPTISDNGGTVAFRSMGHPATEDGPGVWRWRASGSTLTLAFSTDDDTALLDAPVLSADGSTIAFSTDANYQGHNPDGNSELFFWRGSPTQITLSSGDNFVQDLSADGSVIAFTSKANYGGQNDNGNLELFVFDQNAIPTTTQITVTAGPSNGAGAGTISDDGSMITFLSTRELLGNPGIVMPAAEVFLHDRGVATHQLTNAAAGTLQVPSVTGDGTRVFVGSNRNLGGLNPDPVNDTHLFRLGCTIPTFSDVPVSHGFFDEIEWAAAEDVAGGFDDGTYRPTIAVSRQAMASFLYRMMGQPPFTPPATPSFTDVPTTHPFFDEIEWAVAEGVAGGFPDGAYRPATAVSRGAMAGFLYRLVDPTGSFVPPVTPSFSDVPTGHTFYEDIEWAVDADVAGGFANGTYKPGLAVSRQAMAAFLFNLDPLLP